MTTVLVLSLGRLGGRAGVFFVAEGVFFVAEGLFFFFVAEGF